MTIQQIRTCLAAALVVSLSALAADTALAPTKIKPGFNLFSAEQDIEIGRQSAAEIDRQLPILQDPAVASHVNAIEPSAQSTEDDVVALPGTSDGKLQPLDGLFTAG